MTTTAQMTAANFSHGEAITPSDTTPLMLDAVHVGGVGNVALILQDDTVAVTLVAVPAGTTLRARVVRVMATNTTATQMVGLRA